MTIQIKETVCPLDCADTCSLKVEVDDDQLLRVRGSKTNPLTAGKICSKVSNYMVDWVHGPTRLTQPLKRVGPKGDGQFEPISWDQAYQLIKKRFNTIIDEHGSEAIIPFTYGGPMGKLAGGSMAERFFNKLGASHLNALPLCTGATGEAWDSVLGDVGGVSHTEMEHADLIVVWANNITATHLHLIKKIRAAKARGAKLVVIDAKRIRIADEADLFVQPRPGTDVVLALAIANLLAESDALNVEFLDQHVDGLDLYLQEAAKWSLQKAAETTGIAEDDIRTLASWFATYSKTLVSMGVGLERTRNGGASVRAVMALPLLTGAFGPVGSGICDPGGYFDIDSEYLEQPSLRKTENRTINVLDLASEMLQPTSVPIEAVFVYNHNPLAVVPNQKQLIEALSQDSVFSVGFDIQMTDTMRYMDLVLPACSPLEYGDLYKAYGHTYLQRSEPVIRPVGQAKPNTQVFRELAQVFEFNEAAFAESDDDMIANASKVNIEAGDVIDTSLLESAESVFRNGLMPDTPSKRARLADKQLADLGELVPTYKERPNKSRQYTLVTPASEARTNSTFGSAPAQPKQVVEIHPSDAATQGLSAGQQVLLFNDLAQVQLEVCVSERMQRGVVYVDKGAWMHQSQSNLSANALIDGRKADLGEGACYYDTQVDIRPV